MMKTNKCDFKRLIFLFFSLLTFAVIPTALMAMDDFEHGEQCWKAGNYSDAITYLRKYRETPYGRSAYVDYMLGTSGCRQSDLQDWGCDVLQWMLNRYALSEDARTLVKNELSMCKEGTPTMAISMESALQIASLIGASARASGKTFYWLGRDDNFNFYPAYRERLIPKDEMRARLIPIGDRERALHDTEMRCPGFRVSVHDHFIMASRSGHSLELMKKMADYLERYLQFLKEEYNVELPDTYATVYMVSNSDDLLTEAKRLHGLRVSRATFGYSFSDDMSLVVAIPNDFFIGTIMHEFFHLSVRGRFGDIPQWLDEGMASLYEVSRFEGDKVRGMKNWRGKVLVELMEYRPTIRQLVASDWFAFEQVEYAEKLQNDSESETPPARQMAAMLATARYFVFYLQETGTLKNIFNDLQQLTPDPENRSVNAVQDSIRILEKHLGKGIDDIDTDFMDWFKQIEM